MTGLMVELRRERLRNVVLDILMRQSKASAKEIAFELQAHSIWKSPQEVTSIITGDAQLKDRVDINWQSHRGWKRLTFAFRRDYDAPR